MYIKPILFPPYFSQRKYILYSNLKHVDYLYTFTFNIDVRSIWIGPAIEIFVDIRTKCPKYIVIVHSIQNFALALWNIAHLSGAKVWSVLISESVPVVTNIHHFLDLSAGIVSHIAECVNIYPEMRTFLIFYGTTPQISVLYPLSHIICVSNWFINKVRWLCDYVYCLSASSSIPKDLLLWAVGILHNFGQLWWNISKCVLTLTTSTMLDSWTANVLLQLQILLLLCQINVSSVNSNAPTNNYKTQRRKVNS